MKKLLIFLMSLFEISCLADHYGHLTKINVANQAKANPFKITVQTSDQQGKVTKNDGKDYGQSSDKKAYSGGGIQNQELNLADIKSLDLIVPWSGWDGDATIHIRVYSNNEVIAQLDLQDRDKHIKAIGVKNADGQDVDKRTYWTATKCHTSLSSISIGYNPVTGSTTASGGEKCGPEQQEGQCDINLEVTVDASTGHISVNKADQTNCDHA